MRDELPESWKKLDGVDVDITCPFDYEKIAVRTSVTQYDNGRLAVQAITVGGEVSGEPYCKLTVNLVDEETGEDEFFVKIQFGSAPVVLAVAMERMGLIRKIGKPVSSGRVARYAEKYEVVS